MLRESAAILGMLENLKCCGRNFVDAGLMYWSTVLVTVPDLIANEGTVMLGLTRVNGHIMGETSLTLTGLI